MTSPFSGSDWSIGEVYGHRAFDVKNNILTSPIQTDFTWTSGVNVSECYKCNKKRRPNCSCGFYAYYDPANQNVSGDVYGIVRGYGMVDKGTVGFKAEKAEIEALYIPQDRIPSGVDPNGNVSTGPFSKKKKKAPMTPKQNRNRAVFYSALIVASLVLFSLNIPAWTLLWTLISVGLFGVGVGGYVRALARLSPKKNRFEVEGFINFDWYEFKQNYPRIKIYTDRRKMCTDYAPKMALPYDGVEIYMDIYGAVRSKGIAGNPITRPTGNA